MDIWKDIEGYEGKYQVSNLGNVKSLGNNKSRKEKILRLRKDGGNYLTVVLCKNGEHKTCKLHRLVANAFLPKIDGKTHVDHIDGNRQNNNIDNLRWCTSKENNNFDLARKHKSEAMKGKTGAWKGKAGELHNRSKAVLCVETGQIFGSAREAERELKVDNSSIGKCCLGKVKSAGKHPVTGEKLHWKYVN